MFNPSTPKFVSCKQPFPGIEHVAHFPMSPLTLCPLHGGQTSQGKYTRMAPAFDSINDIHEPHGGMAGGVRSGGMPNVPDNSSLNRRRDNSPYSVTHGAPVIWVSSGGVGCQLSTRDVSGRLPTSKKPGGGKGALPPSNHHI